MSNTRADHAPRRAAGPLLVVLLVALAACTSAEEPDDARRSAPDRESAATAEGTALGPGRVRDVARGLERLLERRAAAVRSGDRGAFEAGLDPRDPEFLSGQAVWFDNVVQLPLARLAYRLDAGSLVRDGRSYWGTVEVGLRLAEYDARTVVTRDRYRFIRTRDGFRLASVTDPAWERRNPTTAQPWDLEPVVIREGAGVLGVFDRGSAPRAGEVVTAVERGVAAIAPRIPLEWDRRVVVYALSNSDFLAGLGDVPGGDPMAVDGLTFPVMAAPGRDAVAATRFVLNPRLLDDPGPARDRLIRHELVHVALGARDDRIPLWLGEGLAEYLSVRTIPPAERVISGAALDAARRGLTRLPGNEEFNGPDSLANYGVSWWACEVIAETWGEQTLWTLVEALDGAADPAAELRSLLGVSERQLAARAGRAMLATYDPEQEDEREGKRDDEQEPEREERPQDGRESEPATETR